MKKNFAIIAHIDSGKTTLTERILFYTGKSKKVGEVHYGETVMDYLEEERKRGITIVSAATRVEWKNTILDIIDTPGHADFTIEVQRSLRVLDGAILVFDGVAGVESQTEKVYRQSKEFQTKCICFVNKMDRLGSNFYGCIEQIRSRLNRNAFPIVDPVYDDNKNFVGFIDLIKKQKYIWYSDDINSLPEITDVYLSEFQNKIRNELIENILDDENLLEFLENNKELSTDQLEVFLSESSKTGKIMPVLCGSAFKNKGVQFLLDCVVKLLPDPVDQPFNSGLSALCFKTVIDKYLGQVVYVRIFGGTFTSSNEIYNCTNRKKEKPTKIVQFHADKFIPIDKAVSGDIVGLTGMKYTKTGDTLSFKDNMHMLEPIAELQPVISVELNLTKSNQRDLLSKAIQEVSFTDPSIFFNYDENSSLIVSGMGELQIEVLINTWKEKHGLELMVSEPRVQYKEKPTASKFISYTHKKQTGGAGQWAYIEVNFEPIEQQEIVFESKLVGVSIPREYVPSIELGFRNEAKKGFLIGSPITNLKITLLDGKYHSVDSSSLAFEICARDALREVLNDLKFVIMEPIMLLSVATPEEFLGDVIKDISRRRGEIIDQINSFNYVEVKSYTPIANLFKYISDLRSMTKGRASQVMNFAFYKELPKEEEAKILLTKGQKKI